MYYIYKMLYPKPHIMYWWSNIRNFQGRFWLYVRFALWLSRKILAYWFPIIQMPSKVTSLLFSQTEVQLHLSLTSFFGIFWMDPFLMMEEGHRKWYWTLVSWVEPLVRRKKYLCLNLCSWPSNIFRWAKSRAGSLYITSKRCVMRVLPRNWIQFYSFGVNRTNKKCWGTQRLPPREAIITFKPKKALEGWALLSPVTAGDMKEGCPAGDGDILKGTKHLEETPDFLLFSSKDFSQVPLIGCPNDKEPG